jgi:hypothetical protein
VPFFVNAPQRYTSASGVMVVGTPFELSVNPDCTGPGSSGLVKGESALRIMVKGGGAGVRARPATYPPPLRVTTASSHGPSLSFRRTRPQSSQNFRLVQTCHVRRSTFWPHCAQKFGLYIAISWQFARGCGSGQFLS